MDSMHTAVVTGATSGLGRATAEAIAALPGWRVVLAVRDAVRGQELARQLGADSAVVPVDLASLDSVRAAADVLGRDSAPIDALVLNAGVQSTRADQVSADGHELTFAVNHLAHFLLTERLAPRLAPGARVVVVSSGTHWGRLSKSGPFPAPRWTDPVALATPRDESGQRAYATSKLANVYFGYEAARRHPDLRVSVVDPGLMPATGLARGYPAPARAVYGALAPLLSRLPFAQTPEQAAAQLAALVTAPPDRPAARYVSLGREEPSSPESYDTGRARELWEASERLVG